MSGSKGETREQLQGVAGTAKGQYNQLMGGPSAFESEFIPQSQEYYNQGQRAIGQQTQDYGNIMGGYGDWTKGAGDLAASIGAEGAPKIGYQNVNAPGRSAEGQQALSGYQGFAQTGGYSPQDIQELRARGISPIRAAYGNTQMELDRSRALGGAGGSPNYIAAASKAQRELPGQMADAMTGVNAQLAESIRSGKLAGLQGMTGITESEYGRQMQSSLANQQADLRAQELTQQGLSAWDARRIASQESMLKGIGGQAQLYGTTPAMAATFGNQALNAYQQRAALEQMRQQGSLGLLGAQISAYGGQPQTTPWWQQAIGAAAPIIGAL